MDGDSLNYNSVRKTKKSILILILIILLAGFIFPLLSSRFIPKKIKKEYKDYYFVLKLITKQILNIKEVDIGIEKNKALLKRNTNTEIFKK